MVRKRACGDADDGAGEGKSANRTILQCFLWLIVSSVLGVWCDSFETYSPGSFRLSTLLL
jgi:hypothetical protein